MSGKCAPSQPKHAPQEGAGGGRTATLRIGYDPAGIEALFVEFVLEAHKAQPARVTLDLNTTDDPIHGRQEGRFFHGDYDCSCDLPLYASCGDHLLVAKLRRDKRDGSH